MMNIILSIILVAIGILLIIASNNVKKDIDTCSLNKQKELNTTSMVYMAFGVTFIAAGLGLFLYFLMESQKQSIPTFKSSKRFQYMGENPWDLIEPRKLSRKLPSAKDSRYNLFGFRFRK